MRNIGRSIAAAALACVLAASAARAGTNEITTWTLPNAGSDPAWVDYDPDGQALWFTEPC